MDGDKKIFAIIGVLFVLVFVGIAANSKKVSRVETASEVAETDYPPRQEDEFYLLPEERARWQDDPDSKGFNDSDRQFLEEHGVSEAEARAAEAIMREHGLD